MTSIRIFLKHASSCAFVIAVGLATGVGAFAGNMDLLFDDGFEMPDHLVLNCGTSIYPCSISEADPDALDRTVTLLRELWVVRKAGTMNDVRDYLESQPDVKNIGGIGGFVTFKVDGMLPAIFKDVSADLNGSSASAPGTTVVSNKNEKNKSGLQEVVGEDDNNDGVVDQKDIKRALVLAPYEWQIGFDDRSEDLNDKLAITPGYAGHVTFKRNSGVNDSNISIQDWRTFGDFDVVAISTHGSRVCQIEEDLSNSCEVWIFSGVRWTSLEALGITDIGASIGLGFDELDESMPEYMAVTLLKDFWRTYYAGELNNQLVTFTACETGNTEGSDLAAVMGGDDFVMSGWTESVNVATAFTVALSFYEELAKGVSTDEAYNHVAGLGYFPYVNSDGVETTFELFAPRYKPVRLIELPQLMLDGEVIQEGANITALVDGTPGDTIPDNLALTVHVNGVTPESKPDFKLRYRVDGQLISGDYDLSAATLLNGFENRYEVTHNVTLGFPLQGGVMPIEVIVDLPEGGESQFSTTVVVASCAFAVNVSGDKTDFFDGPAQFEISQNGAIDFTFRSRGLINQDLPSSAEANFRTAAANPLTPGTYELISGALGYNLPAYSASYLKGFEDLDCLGCGGTLTIDTYAEGQSLSGNMMLKLPRIFPPPEDGQTPTVTLNAEFVAAFGSSLDGGSPYVQCSSLYAE